MTVYQSQGMGARPKKNNTVQALLLKPARGGKLCSAGSQVGLRQKTPCTGAGVVLKKFGELPWCHNKPVFVIFFRARPHALAYMIHY